MTEEPKIDKLTEALALAQGSFTNPLKDRENPYFHSRYASLDALQNATREGLSKNGLAVTQVGRQGVNSWELHTMLLHSSGQYVTSAFPLTAFPKGPQAAGSEITYMRRYAYAAILNITADEDDDANGASTPQGNIPDPNKLPQRPAPAPQQAQAAPTNGDHVQGKIDNIQAADDGEALFFNVGEMRAWTRDKAMMVQLVKMQGETVRAHLRKKTPEAKSFQLISFVPAESQT
jgi:hypothetical protein